MTSVARVRVESRGDVAVASIHGEIDLTNSGRIATQLFAAIPNTARGLVLDLSDTTYIDSRGVQLILDAIERLQTRQQAMHLVVPADSPLWRLFGILSIAQVATLYQTVDAAVEAFAEH
jgi:anti-sigma B factor antagonist